MSSKRKFTSRILFLMSSMLFISSMPAFAEVPCPPKQMILDHAHFIKADYLGNVSWRVFSENFKYETRNWFFILGFPAPDATTPEGAMKDGEEFIRTKTQFFDEPTGYGEKTFICFYAQSAFDNLIAYSD